MKVNLKIVVNSSSMIFACLLFILSCSCNSDKPSRKTNHAFVSDIIPLPDNLQETSHTHLKPLIQMLGDVQIIAVTEALHAFNEPLDFRNALIQYLAEKELIDVIAMEYGIINYRWLNDYILGEMSDIDSVLYYSFSRYSQNKELIEWLRNYNLDSTRSHKIKLYGFDIPDLIVYSGSNTAIKEPLKYLRRVDSASWIKFRERFDPYINYTCDSKESLDYELFYSQLSENQKNDITWAINDLIMHFEINEISYSMKSTEEDYAWAYLAAICSRQKDNWLRTRLVARELSHIKRDRAMVDNVKWIMDREDNPRILLFASIYHLQRTISKSALWGDTVIHEMEVLGHYLSKRYGDKYKVIGNFHLIANNKYMPPSSSDTINGVQRLFIHPQFNNYYRDIKAIDDELKALLNKEWMVGINNWPDYGNPYASIDVLFFTKRQTEVSFED